MTKIRPWSAPQLDHAPLGTVYTPSQLTMRPVHAERSRNILPQSGPHVPLAEEFHPDDLFATRWANWTGAGTATVTLGGQITVTASGALARTYRSQTVLAAPTGVFASVRVEAATGDDTVAVGFYSTNGGPQVEAVWDRASGDLSVGAAGGITGGGATGTLAHAGRPVWLALLLAWPATFVMTSLDGRHWHIHGQQTVGGSTLTDPAVWRTLRPGFRVALADTSTAVLAAYRAGYAGSYGYRDFKAVTWADGTPLRKDGRYWFTGTVAHGNADFRSNHAAIWSFCPDSYRTDLVHHLFWDVPTLGVGAAYPGHLVYDDGQWIMACSTWGFGNVGTGIDTIVGGTSRDLLTPGVTVLRGEIITPTMTDKSLYDPSIRRDQGGTWWLCAVETTVRSGWSGGQHGPAVFAGPDLTSLSRYATASNTAVDGTVWGKIGGEWYVFGGASDGYRAWLPDMTGEALLSSWSSQIPGGLVTFGAFPAHPALLVVDDGWRTRYLLATYDTSLVLSLNASKGGLVVLEADEKPVGQEFAPKVAPRLYGS
jgi:hypothetical protein